MLILYESESGFGGGFSNGIRMHLCVGILLFHILGYEKTNSALLPSFYLSFSLFSNVANYQKNIAQNGFFVQILPVHILSE